MISTNIPEEILELERQLPNDFEIYKDSLPKEPTDPDAKKEYTVGCYSADDWHFVHEILMQDGTLEDNIPDHSCECVNDCLHSPTRGIYLLTDSEAEELRNSPKVEYVNINVGKYPGTYLRNPKDLIASGEVQFQRYSSPVSNQRYFPFTFSQPDTQSDTTTYPEMCRYFIVGIETNTTSTAWRTTGAFSHRGGTASAFTDNPSFELESGDYFVILNYDVTNNPITIQTTSGIGGNAYSGEISYSSIITSGGNTYNAIRWYTETPGTYYYQSQNTSSMVGTITVTERDTVDSSLKDRCGYQLLRHKEQQDPWSSSTLNDVINDTIRQRGDGTDVDVIVADTMAWFGHIEFQNNLGGPKGYRGGNVLPGNGTCDLLDLVLDAPYYLDPDFFNANPSKLTTRWDGTIVPTDSAAHSWWENNSTSHRSAKFVSPANGGTATGDNDFGIVGSISNNYLREYAGTHTERNSLDTHGTACASQTYGRQYGWAYNANKWYINLYGTFASDIEVGFDIQKIFHKVKPINSKYGTRNPTISSNSWRIPYQSGILGQPTGYYYYRSGDTGSNGVAFSITSLSSGGSPEFMTNHYSSGIQNEQESDSLLTAGNELIDAGVIVVCAAGNENQKLVKADHPDYNNYYSSSNNTALTSATYTYDGHTYRKTINRAGMPLQIGASGSGTSKVYKTICVGALDDDYNSGANSKESKVAYSNRGNLVDIFMAADGTAAAGAATFNASYDYRYIRPDQYYTINGVQSRPSFDTRFSGTSSACPIFAGLLATKLQYQRDWTYAEVKEWISSLGEMDPNDFYYGTESTTVDDSNWSDDYSLEGAPAIVGWDKPTRDDYAPLRISGNINFRTNIIPDFEITNLPSNVDEGQSISPTIGATPPVWKNLITNDSYRVYWQLSGVGIASTDFENVSADGNPDTGTTLTGYVDTNVPSGAKQFSIGIRSDTHTDDPDGAVVDASENATLSIYRDSARTTLLDSKTFAINDTSVSDNYEVLLVAGGARGGHTTGSANYITWGAAGGGGAGGVRHLSLQSLFGNGAGQYTNVYFEIGDGGAFPQSNGGPTKMYDGTSNSGTLLYQVEGGGVGAYNNGRIFNTNGDDVSAIDGGDAPANGGSGGGGNSHCDSGNTLGGSAGLYGNDGGGVSNRGGGGNGGGAGGAAPTRTAFTSRGGYGYDLTNFFSELSTDGPDGDGRIAGGGGGGHTVSQNGVYEYGSGPVGTGEAGGGDGGYTGSGGDAAANSGSGGGGAGGIKGSQGGNGGSGIVYLKYASETQLVGNWTGTASDHTVTSYDQSVAGGIKRTWIHKIIGDGALSLL